MRWWPIRRRRLPPPPPPDEMLVTEDRLRRTVEDVLAVRDRQIHGGIVVFRGELMTEPARALDLLIARFRPLGYTPYLREEAGLVALQALPITETATRWRIGVNVVLFVLTCLSTLVAGLSFVGSPTFDALRSDPSAARFLAGAPFACTLLAILGVHELGHYFTARHYRASVSLPFFIPAPPPLFLFGTMGAIIRMRSPARDRNSLFDIAAAGPLAGLAVAVPAVVIGLAWSTVMPAPQGGYLAFGDSLLIRWLVHLRFGSIPGGSMVFTHPVADAAWAGFLVTALNLFPVGQLDGGRIAYALFGRHHRTVRILTVAGLILMGLLTWSPNWFVWAALLFLLIGFHHGAILDDVTPLSPGRRAVGFACFVLMVLLVPPVPIQFG